MAVTDLVTSAAYKYGVDPNLALSVAKAESGLDPNAKSGAGAIGVMQLMPSSFPGVNIYDPATNVDAGVGYLAQLLNKYNGDQTLALAAYNAGPRRVAQYGGVPPFAETQNYIAKVQGWLQLGGDSGSSSSDSGVDVAYVDPNSTSDFPLDGTSVAVVVGVGLVAGLLLMEL